MAKNCNGVKILQEEFTKSPVEAAKPGISDNDSGSKKFPLETGYRGYITIPHVRLERYDITAYLDRHRLPVTHRKIRKDRGKDDALHKKRLSQKCLVILKRDDLDTLKASFQGRPETPSSTTSQNSDSESCNSTDIAMKCNICEKTYNSERKLQKHQQNKHIIYKTENTKSQKRVSFSDHVIVHEVKEYHKCRKCPKIFEDYQLLKSHMRRWHKKRKCYICNYCSRCFADRMFFKVHIRLHCDICGELLPNRSRYLEHRRDVCRVYKLHQCKACEELFFKIMDLKDHSYDHLGACYVCDICKDRFKSKCAIAHHHSFLHSKKRPKDLYVMRKMGTERLYLCKFCDASSVEREVIENHIQKLPDLTNKATTGYKDYYFCDQCMKKFDTETDMLQHKWTHFLKTSDNSQTRPKSILTKRKPEIKTTYNISEELPEFMQPFVVLEKVDDIYPIQYVEFIDVSNYSNAENMININKLKKAIVDPKSKKTIVSKHQCETCGKYFSTNYCLNRHIATQHEDFDSLRCKVCEETFVWPSLLKSHKCIRLNHPELPFDDARAEILFDNHYTENGFDDLNIDDDYMNAVDFEIPAPVVELRECDSTFMPNNVVSDYVPVPNKNGVTSSGYRLVMQEVPIEF